MSEKIEIVAELKDLISGKFKDMNSQLDAMQSKFDQMNAGGSRGGGGIMGQVLGANLLTSALQRAASEVIQFGKDSFNAYGKAEQFQVALTTLLYGNKDAAVALNNQLKQFALETPFELTEIREGTRMMIAYGSSAGGVVSEMRMLGDIGAGVGSSLSELAYLYGTLRTQGIAYTRDLNQFTNRGIPVIKQLAKQFGVAESAIRKMTEEGKIGFSDFEKAFKSMTAEGGQFNNMMAQQSKTLLGQTSNLSDAWNQLQVEIGQSQEGILKGTVAWATEMVTAIKKSYEYENEKDAAFKKYHAEDFTFAQRMGGHINAALRGIGINIKSDVSGFDQFQDAINKMYVQGNKTPLDAVHSENALRGLLKNQYKAFDERERAKKLFQDNEGNYDEGAFKAFEKQFGKSGIDKAELDRNQAILRGAIDKVVGQKNLLKQGAAEKDKKAEEKPKDLETLAKGNRMTQIYVTIENLVRELTNKVGTPDEAMQLTAQRVSQVLVGAVNDLYAVGQ